MAAIFTTPLSQALRFVNINKKTDLQTYDNRFADELKYFQTSKYHYCQTFLNTKQIWFQYRTNYRDIDIYIVDSENIRININSYKELLYTDSSGRSYYNVLIPLIGIEGYYFIEITGSDVDKSTFTFQSEIFKFVSELPNSLLIEWRGNDFGYDDSMDWTNHNLKQHIYVDGRDRELQPEQNKTVYQNSNYTPINLKSKPIRNVNLEFERIPYWIIEKINIALSHDEFYCNESKYNSEDVIEVEQYGDSNLYKGNVLVTAIDFENGEDDEITGGEIAEGYILLNDNDIFLINDSNEFLKANN